MTQGLSITVACEDSSHYNKAAGKGKRAKIQTFWLGQDGHWLGYGALRRGDARSNRASVAAMLAGQYAGAAGTGPTARQDRVAERRVRWDLRCPLCGLALQIRDEKLQPFLDGVAEAKVEHVTFDSGGGVSGRLFLDLRTITAII